MAYLKNATIIMFVIIFELRQVSSTPPPILHGVPVLEKFTRDFINEIDTCVDGIQKVFPMEEINEPNPASNFIIRHAQVAILHFNLHSNLNEYAMEYYHSFLPFLNPSNVPSIIHYCFSQKTTEEDKNYCMETLYSVFQRARMENPIPFKANNPLDSLMTAFYYIRLNDLDMNVPDLYFYFNLIYDGVQIDLNSFIAYECYKNITLFCDNEVTSDKCLKKAILHYEKNIHILKNGHLHNLPEAVHFFFSNFPINAGNIPLPVTFCHNRGDHYPNPNCLHALDDYQELSKKVKRPINRDREQRDAAKTELRYNIAKMALVNRTIVGLNPNSYEASYLNKISENITSAKASYNPNNYCQQLQNHNNSQNQIIID